MSLFLHFEYHKNDIPKSRVRAIYDKHCKELLSTRLGIKQLTIAYSRPENIKDTITKAKLHQAPGHEASKYYSGSKHHHNTATPKISSPCVFRPTDFRLHCEEIFRFLISIFEIIFCSYNNTSACLAKITTKNVIKHIGTPRKVPHGSTGSNNTYLIDCR